MQRSCVTKAGFSALVAPTNEGLLMERNRYETKKYLHFDDRIGFDTSIQSYVTNPNRIMEHGFFPFIHYTISYEQYDEKANRSDNRPIKEKFRDIMYASHLDNFIYKYYGEELNENYNDWVKANNVDHCSVAYRYKKGEKGKSNIDFAAEVISYIYDLSECFIMVGDFEKFFDTLDHFILKKRIAEVLGANLLREDWYKVFKSVTRYSYYSKKLLNKELGTDKEIKKKGRLKYFETPKKYREFRKRYKPKKNREHYGIPQGTAISAILSNVYTIHFDVLVNNLINKYNGLYRRYSDDFIIVIPKGKQRTVNVGEFRKIEGKIYQYIKLCKLNIQDSKTKLYDYSEGKVVNISENKVDMIDYLGFVFDGESVKMRGKSPYKFYRHSYKLIKRAKKVKEKKNLRKIPYRRQLYRLYTDMGINRQPFGNFITYAINAQQIFDEISPHTDNLMMQQIKNRKKRIEKRLGVKLSIR